MIDRRYIGNNNDREINYQAINNYMLKLRNLREL